MKVGPNRYIQQLEVRKGKNARYLLASISETYSDPQVRPQIESYGRQCKPVSVRGVYDEAKRFSEALAVAYHRTRKLSAGIIRIFNTRGP
jgi:dTDP-glucose 4,6-dehydratase